MLEPLVMIEILSPTNVSRTRANIRAYTTIPMVKEIVEVLRRGPDGAWPQQPETVGGDGELRLDSIGFAAPLRDAYRTSGLA
jgi:Uma2 family endonuclease